jgi:hypothetical protein
MQMSLNLQAALLARAVAFDSSNGGCAVPFYTWDHFDKMDLMDQDDYFTIVKLLETISFLGA